MIDLRSMQYCTASWAADNSRLQLLIPWQDVHAHVYCIPPTLGRPGHGGRAPTALRYLHAHVQPAQQQRGPCPYTRLATSNLERTNGSLNAALEAIERVKAEAAAAADKFVYVQQLRAYIADLCDCLAYKVCPAHGVLSS